VKQYVVDAFTDQVFAGNQAAVCVLDCWLDDDLMQKIAVENNFSETAFAVKEEADYRLRWFTPGGEIDLCGHATLATGYVILRFYEPDAPSVTFRTLSGPLIVARRGTEYEMDFPAYALHPVPVTDAMEQALGVRPQAAYLDRDLLLVLEEPETVANLAPDQDRLLALDGLLQIVSAPGGDYDCVSRVFAPKLAVPEDPVTGSAHCMLAPYWTRRLGKAILSCYQASQRTGTLTCSMAGDRVKLAGQAALFAVSDLLPDRKDN